MVRSIVAVVVGFALWTALWLAGNFGLAQLFPDAFKGFERGEPLTDKATLACTLALSCVCSYLAGAAVARFTGGANKRVVWILATLLLLTGSFVQLGVWDYMPLWYHLSFLALLIPVCLFGARGKGADRSPSLPTQLS